MNDPRAEGSNDPRAEGPNLLTIPDSPAADRRSFGGQTSWGFSWGAGTGVVLTLIAILIVAPPDPSEVSSRATVGAWIDANLGHSIWLFALVFTLYVMNLTRLNRQLNDTPSFTEVAELDQLLDVWIHLFVGIGVIWTAVGMRSALQAALGDPGEALVDTAGSVLQKLVDGGILLALTTTIAGGVGSYLMRLGKTMIVGAALNTFYDANHRSDMHRLIAISRRIEQRMGDDGWRNRPQPPQTPEQTRSSVS